jgi:hypothetical protein
VVAVGFGVGVGAFVGGGVGAEVGGGVGAEVGGGVGAEVGGGVGAEVGGGVGIGLGVGPVVGLDVGWDIGPVVGWTGDPGVVTEVPVATGDEIPSGEVPRVAPVELATAMGAAVLSSSPTRTGVSEATAIEPSAIAGRTSPAIRT